jgi:hypothetical protein
MPRDALNFADDSQPIIARRSNGRQPAGGTLSLLAWLSFLLHALIFGLLCLWTMKAAEPESLPSEILALLRYTGAQRVFPNRTAASVIAPVPTP